MKLKTHLALFIGFVLTMVALTGAQPSLLENLGRGLVAVRSTTTEVFISWRVLGTDPSDISFNLYRSTAGGAPVKLNVSPITGATNFVDSTANLALANVYTVRPIVYGVEQPAAAPFSVVANAAVQQYLRVPLQLPAGGVTPAGEAYTYSPNDCSVGDLDGDGEYDIVVKWDPSNSKDNSQSGYTGNVYLDGYKLDGTLLWRIDLGVNIRAGAHYTQFQVYDLDGDGKAEIACRTAEGSKDGLGNYVADPAKFTGTLPPIVHTADRRNGSGYILGGPEFLTIFNGQTGAELASTNYNPPRHPDTLFPTTAQINAIWGDNYGNRIDRFLAGVAYLDGQRPSLVMCRGYYTRAVVVAYDYRNGQLTQRWIFDTNPNGGAATNAAYRGQGSHSLTIGDVDGDGKDEIVYGAACIDDNGTGLYSTTLGHGDALHLTDMDPDRPGMEIWMPHEDPGSYGPNAAEFRDARTGALIFGVQGTGDIGRGLALDIDPRYRGYELWASSATGGMYTSQLSTPNAALGPRGVQISSGKPSINFGVWWDGDLLRELLDNTSITKWNWLSSNTTTLLSPSGIASNNSTKATPNLSADILGDWREEVIWRETGNNALRIYTTTIPTTYRFYTLMHDRQYREAIAWQNTAYNQPPHPSFFLGDGMAPAPAANIVTTLSTLLGPVAPVITAITNDTGVSTTDFLTNDPTLVIQGVATPNVTVNVVRQGVGPIGSVLSDPSGNWSLDYTATALPNGVASFITTATDASNNTGAPSAPFSITVDLIPPAAPVISTISSGATLSFSGTAEAGSTVTVTLAGTGSIGTAQADSSGLWTLNYSGAPLPLALQSFTATATDAAGNTSAPSGAFAVNTSIAAPAVTGVSDDTGISTSDGITSDNKLVISGTASAGATVNVIRTGSGIIGSVLANGSGAWSFDYSGTTLADGAYAFSAVVQSGADNSPSSPVFLTTVDTVAPTVVSINRQTPSAATTSAANLVFRVTFSEAVAGVDGADFTPVLAGGVAGVVSSIVPAGATSYDVTVGPLIGEGTVRLDLNASSTGIGDAAGNLLATGFTAGQSYTRLLIGNGTWIKNQTDGLWSANANWLEGIVGGNAGNTADFSTLELVDDISVHLDSPRTIGNLIFGDTDIVSAASWTIDNNGSAANILTLGVVSGSPSITVNPLGLNAVVTLDTSVAGTAGLTKLGTGSLILTRPNTLTGALNINAGLFRLASGSSLNIGNNAVNLGSGASMEVIGASFTTGGLVSANTSPLVVGTGATVALNGGFRTNSDFSGTLRVTGGTMTTNDVNIRRNAGTSPDYASGFVVQGGTSTVGTIGLGTANSYGCMSVEGGTVTATGAITIGNQTTVTSGVGRGGALRVIGGTFNSTNAAGIVLCRNNGTTATNVGTATFTGGVSTVEKLVFGFDSAVNAQSATITVNGGTLYVGSGGIIKNGTSGFVTTLSLSSGTLGAKAVWSTSHPVTLASGSINLKAADALNAPFDITFSGGVSGAGGFTKVGTGTLIISGANTYTGATNINAGTLRIDGTLAAGGAFNVNSGGTLAGSGTISKAITLNSGGKIAPSAVLTGASAVWNGGGALKNDLSAGTRLTLTGALTKGSAGNRAVELVSTAAPVVDTTYTLANYASTDLTLGDLSLASTSGFLGVLQIDATSLKFLVTGVGATAEYTHWAYLQGLPAGQKGPLADPDGDGLSNLQEFYLALNPLVSGGDGVQATTVAVGSDQYPGIIYIRRQAVGGVSAQVLVSPDLGFTSLLGSTEVSVTPNGDGTETVIRRSNTPLSTQPTQFFRIAVSYPVDNT